MARKTAVAAAAAAATSEGIENIPPKPKAKATAKPAAAAGVKKKAPSTKKVAKIFYEFRYCNRTYSGFYTYREFMENCVKCLRHELSFLPKPLLTERAKKLWEAKASEVEGPHVVLKTTKKPAQAKKAKDVQPTKRKNSKPIDLYEEPDNFYDWNDDDAANLQKVSKKTPVRKLPPKTTSAPKKLDFFLGDLLLLDSKPAEVGRPSVIQKYRTMLGNEFIPLDSSSPQVPAKKSSGGVPVKGGKGKQQQAAANNKPPPLTTMIELISG
ncbi:hypothetical protein TYRP_010401 [Tyrophagus putrescentiae]|nr:hypothetical protein TYRP_010401 [Tyrophagus putrescentiae]